MLFRSHATGKKTDPGPAVAQSHSDAPERPDPSSKGGQAESATKKNTRGTAKKMPTTHTSKEERAHSEDPPSPSPSPSPPSLSAVESSDSSADAASGSEGEENADAPTGRECAGMHKTTKIRPTEDGGAFPGEAQPIEPVEVGNKDGQAEDMYDERARPRWPQKGAENTHCGGGA